MINKIVAIVGYDLSYLKSLNTDENSLGLFVSTTSGRVLKKLYFTKLITKKRNAKEKRQAVANKDESKEYFNFNNS